MLARLPIDPWKALLADEGRIEEVEDTVCDNLAASLIASIDARPKVQEVISIIERKWALANSSASAKSFEHGGV